MNEKTAPKAAAQRRNPPRPAAQMRTGAERGARDAAADRVAALWREMSQNEPLLAELLLPEEFRDALAELVRTSAS